MNIRFTLNGRPFSCNLPPDRPVVRVLRQDLGLVGTKECCGAGECGGCTVLLDGQARLSCLMLAAQLQGRNLVTIEGLEAEGELHPVQEAFVHSGAIQCGYCTPGMIQASIEFLERNPSPSRDEIREALSGNICRCTGYQKILDAVENAAAMQRESARAR